MIPLTCALLSPFRKEATAPDVTFPFPSTATVAGEAKAATRGCSPPPPPYLRVLVDLETQDTSGIHVCSNCVASRVVQ